MTSARVFSFRWVSLLLALLPLPLLADSARWNVPLGGNAYLTTRFDGAADEITREGIRNWAHPGSTFSVFFHVDRPASLDLALVVGDSTGEAVIRCNSGDQVFDVVIPAGPAREVPVGIIEAKAAGYLRVNMVGVRKAGKVFADIDSLMVSSQTAKLKLDMVKSNQGNMFYWGRRGPSVHLGYKMPAGKTIEYAYSEMTVPHGEDPVGSYFMANGFGEGYFGMQVIGPGNRKVLFSVWSPAKTDNPRDIPADERVVVLAKGEGVLAKDFGNEGSGGQSFLDYPWQTGRTYRFLNSATPDGKGNTIYTAWFGDKAKDEWRLVASFLRPKTNKHLTGFHSFLENFADRRGYFGRRANYANQWVRDTGGRWHEITRARFTGDGTAGGGHRLDYAGGSCGNGFFLRNGGYFNDRVELNREFQRDPGPDTDGPLARLPDLPAR